MMKILDGYTKPIPIYDDARERVLVLRRRDGDYEAKNDGKTGTENA